MHAPRVHDYELVILVLMFVPNDSGFLHCSMFRVAEKDIRAGAVRTLHISFWRVFPRVILINTRACYNAPGAANAAK